MVRWTKLLWRFVGVQRPPGININKGYCNLLHLILITIEDQHIHITYLSIVLNFNGQKVECMKDITTRAQKAMFSIL